MIASVCFAVRQPRTTHINRGAEPTSRRRERIQRQLEATMSTGAAADGLLRYVFEGCIDASDAAKERRPYHRNCGCALHGGRGSGAPPPCRRSLSYPIRRSWSGSHLMAAAGSAHLPPSASPGDSPGIPRTRSHADGLGDLDL